MRPPQSFLAARLKKGDERAFHQLYHQWHGRVFHFCLKHVGQVESAEELTADVFVLIWKKRFDLEPLSSLSGLLFKIARDLCIDHLRKVSRSNQLRDVFLESLRLKSVQSSMNDLIFQAYQDDLDKAVDKLPDRCKEVFQLNRQGYSHREIAQLLAISASTVKVQIFRARKMIKTNLMHLSDVIGTSLILYFLC